MTCQKCHGLMHEEWTPATRNGLQIRLMACFICGNREDYEIRLHRMFSGPQADKRVEAWKRVRRLVALQEEKEALCLRP